jgi:hypothetical protein
MKKVFSQFIGMLMLSIVSLLVAAWGYQIVWNEIVLRIWQMFADGDVVNTLALPYGVFVAVTAGVGLLRKHNPDKSETLEEAISKAFGKIVTRLIWIGITLAIVAIVF